MGRRGNHLPALCSGRRKVTKYLPTSGSIFLCGRTYECNIKQIHHRVRKHCNHLPCLHRFASRRTDARPSTVSGKVLAGQPGNGNEVCGKILSPDRNHSAEHVKIQRQMQTRSLMQELISNKQVNSIKVQEDIFYSTLINPARPTDSVCCRRMANR